MLVRVAQIMKISMRMAIVMNKKARISSENFQNIICST